MSTFPGGDPTVEDKKGHVPHEYADRVKSFLEGKVDEVSLLLVFRIPPPLDPLSFHSPFKCVTIPLKKNCVQIFSENKYLHVSTRETHKYKACFCIS